MNQSRKFFLTLTLAFAEWTAFAQTNADLPPFPPLRSPVDSFRELLNMPSAERAKSLADRPTQRERLLEKLREYQGLSADERELRLRATELRWWLLSLMHQPETNHSTALATVPAHIRTLVKDRLSVWSLLPPLQKELLDNEEIAQRFTRIQGLTAEQRERNLNSLSPKHREFLEAGLKRWTALSDEERRETCNRFEQFFTLNERERQKVLSTLSETERQQMEQTLRSFENLPREQRGICVRSFEKFASMSVAERQQFLKSAERWEKMSPGERQNWRILVNSVPNFPPLPADFYNAPPPLPPGMKRPSLPATTNGG